LLIFSKNPQKEITKRAGSKWNSMSEEEKAPYVAKALKTRVKWEKQLQIYKNEIKNGVCNSIKNTIGFSFYFFRKQANKPQKSLTI